MTSSQQTSFGIEVKAGKERPLHTVILWDKVWNSIHSSLDSNDTKAAIWEQLHLKFYTEYSYNKWHSTLCPLCHEIPVDIYH